MSEANIMTNHRNTKKSHKKEFAIGMLAGFGIGSITFAGLIAILTILFLFGGAPEISTDITAYESNIANYTNIHSGFIVFPEHLLCAPADADYYFAYQDTWNDPTCEVYLKCTYTEEDYQKEVDRLSHIYKQYGSVRRDIEYDDSGRFPYPAYIAIDGHRNAYEYALLSGDHEITYIYTSFMNQNKLHMDTALLPSDYDQAMNLSYEQYLGKRFSIYLSEINYNNQGDPESWDYDYTREENVQLLQYEYVSINDYDYFQVEMIMDENDNPIINRCLMTTFPNRHEAFYGTGDITEYTELHGYLYKNLTVDEASHTITVTYEEDGTIKTMMYPY